MPLLDPAAYTQLNTHGVVIQMSRRRYKTGIPVYDTRSNRQHASPHRHHAKSCQLSGTDTTLYEALVRGPAGAHCVAVFCARLVCPAPLRSLRT